MTGLQISFSISQAQKLKVGYRVAGSTGAFTYLPQYLQSTDSPYLISGLSAVSYEVEMTAYSSGCNSCNITPCSSPVYSFFLLKEDNILNGAIRFSVDYTGNIQAITLFSEATESTISISGNYTLKDINGVISSSEAWSITIPLGVSINVANIRQATPTTQISQICITSISPSTVMGKSVQIVNLPAC